MADEVKYDKHYRESAAACGDPFPAFAAYAERHGAPGVTVLDLGCGQGRDALLFGRRGCDVLGVDASSVGVEQLNATAASEGLSVRAVVADLTDFQPVETYDVVILDRVLHMLATDEDRRALLEVAAAATRPGGVVLVADGPKNRALIRGHFVDAGWQLFKDTKNRTFAHNEQG